MKIQLETISPSTKSPFRLLHNPNLSALFYWHFHPEYELVYIEGANATRHVGNHISNYENSDLVFIGSNIPHLNFDYGVQTDYKKEGEEEVSNSDSEDTSTSSFTDVDFDDI